MKQLMIMIAMMGFSFSLYAGDFDLSSNQASSFTGTKVEYMQFTCQGNPGERQCCVQYRLENDAGDKDPNGSKDYCEALADMPAGEKSSLAGIVKRMSCLGEGGCN